jgi:hypothetical protein
MLTKNELDQQILVRIAYVKSHENLYIRSRVVPCGPRDGSTDVTKLTVTFCSYFTNAPVNRINSVLFNRQ